MILAANLVYYPSKNSRSHHPSGGLQQEGVEQSMSSGERRLHSICVPLKIEGAAA